MGSPAARNHLRLVTLVVVLVVVSYSLWWGDDLLVHTFRPLHNTPQGGDAEAIPKKIWYKLGPNGLNNDTQAWTDTCILNNTAYEVDFMSDMSADAFVQDTFNVTHPTLVETYFGLQGSYGTALSFMNVWTSDSQLTSAVPILKADLLRYLLLYSHGGVYLDLDVSCETPMDEWIPSEYKHDIGLVVGWEFDIGWGDNIIREFVTWAMMAKPDSPHLWRVVEDILAFFEDTMAKNSVPVQGLTLAMVGDVVDATGPRRFTRSIIESMGESFHVKIEAFHNLLTPKLVGDVLVLPGYAWAASANKYHDVLDTVPPPSLSHHYAGSWKNDKGGETAEG